MKAARRELLAGEISQASAAYATRPGDVAEMKRVAARLEKDNPRWIVLFGVWSKEFVAFPRFTAPRGTVVAARYPGALPARMRAVENKALPAGAASAATGSQAVPEPSEGPLR